MKARNTYQKIELLIATLIAGFFILITSTSSAYYSGRHQFSENHISYDFNTNYLQPFIAIIVISYLLFVFLTQYVETKTKGFFKVILFVCSYLLLAFTFSVCFTYIFAWRYGNEAFATQREVDAGFFAEGFAVAAVCFLIYLTYYGLKELLFSPFLKKKLKESNGSKVLYAGLSVLAWLFIFIMLSANDAVPFFIIAWVVVLPYALLIIYLHTLVLLPSLPEKKPFSNYYLSRVIPVTLLINFIATVFCMAIGNGGMPFVGAFFLLLVWTWIAVIPLSWWIFRNQKEKLGLKTALGSSQANLGFLRSQINPHFLFNALNTLYGTALQENAERTGEGIQKLGDMMRFMLHENMQDKIYWYARWNTCVII